MEENEEYNAQNEEENEEKETEKLSPILALHRITVYAEPEEKNFQWGVNEGSYLAGFASVINVLGLSEETVANILLNKIGLEYQKEIIRMQLESAERVASIYAKTPLNVNYNGGNE